MPRNIISFLNNTAIYGQHYKKKSLILGKELRSEGICHGLAVAWIKKVHTLNSFLKISLPTPTEGALIQNKLDYNFNTRKYAIKKEEYTFDYEHYNENVSPNGFFKNDKNGWLKSYSDIGFHIVKYCGSMTPSNFVCFLEKNKKSHICNKIKTFLICTGGHAMAIAINYKYIAFFDSNHGIIIYNHKEAIDDALICSKLNECLLDYKIKQLAVVELEY